MKPVPSALAATALLLGACGGTQQIAHEDLDNLFFEELPSPAGPDSLTPYVNVDHDGVVRMSWQERTGKETSLFFATLDDGAWSEPRRIASGTNWFVNWADFPSLVGARDGRLIAHWLERLGEDTYAYGARFVVSADAGRSWSEPRWLHNDTQEVEHGFVSFAAANREGSRWLQSGGFEAFWLDGRNAGGGHDSEESAHGSMAFLQRPIDFHGRLGPEAILDTRVCSCCQTDVAWRSDGMVSVFRDRSNSEIRDITATWTQSRGPSFSASPNTPLVSRRGSVHDDGWEIFGCPVNGPAIDALGERCAVAWFTGAQSDDHGGGVARVAFSAPTSASPSAPLFLPPIDVDDGVPEGRVDAVFLENGALLVTWMEHGEDGTEWRVRAIAPDGSLGQSLTIAPVSSDRRTGFLRMDARGNEAFLAWTDIEDGSLVRTGRLRFKP